MPEEITYIATNTDIQVIDTFDPGSIKAATYVCQIDTEAETNFVQFKVVHDGVTAGITQQGLSVSDNAPIIFDANIYSHTGEIKVTPVSQPTTIVIEKTEFLANNYAEHTKCGRWIKGSVGFAINPDTVVIRQANNNVYNDPLLYLVANTLGPVEDGPNLISNPEFIDSSAWIPHNDAVLSGGLITTNNIYKDNFIYQAFEAELGYSYRASVSGNSGSLVVGSTLSNNNYVNAPLSLMLEEDCTPNTVTSMYDSYLHKIVPFNTYRWDLGTFYLKWANTAVNTVLFKMLTVEGYTREVKVNSSGSVQITENTAVMVIGPQAGGNNKLSFSYEDGFIASLNGNTIVSNLNIEILDNMISLEFITPALQFSYVPTVISNTELVVLSNG